MLPDRIFTLTMSYDGESADLVAVVTRTTTGVSEYKEWSTTAVGQHDDNEWHTVRDLIVDFVGECF